MPLPPLIYPIAVLFCCHASDALEISVEGCRFGETKYVGSLLKCLCGVCFDEVLGLCRYILLYPFCWREAVGDHTDNFAEMLGGEVQQIGIIFDLSRFPIVFYNQVAETVEDVCMSIRCPFSILITTVVIEEFIAHGELRQQGLIAVGQFLVGVVGDDVKLIDDGEQVCGLLVG